MKVEIKDYTGRYYSALYNLLNAVYNTDIDQVTLEKNYLTNNRSILIAVTETDYLIGCAFVEIQEDYVRTCRTLFITYVAVDERYRNQGVGRMIFEAVEEIAKKKKAKAVELTSADYRINAHAFYHAIGYSKKKTTVFIKEI